MATKQGAASLVRRSRYLAIGCITESLCLNKSWLLLTFSQKSLRFDWGEIKRKKRERQDLEDEEGQMSARASKTGRKRKRKEEFDCQALMALIEMRDDGCDRPLHKHRAAGSL